MPYRHRIVLSALSNEFQTEGNFLDCLSSVRVRYIL